MRGLDTDRVEEPTDIEPTEELGRGVYASRDMRRAERGTIPLSVFELRDGEEGLSVDRLTLAPEEAAITIAKKRAAAMKPLGERSFYGWAVMSAERAQRSGRKVQASPLDDGSNDYHADIICPDSYVNDEGNEVDHREDLSSLACWLPLKNLNRSRQPS